MYVEVLPVKPVVNSGNAKATGKPYRIVKQAALFVNSKGEAAAISIQPPRDGDPYAPGKYTISEDSFYERDGELRFIPRLAGASSDRAVSK